MKKIQLHAYAKINLTLDVTGRRPNGYHDVEMIMQQISLCDTITVGWEPDPGSEGIGIRLAVSRPDLPADASNLAWKAAEAMIAGFGGSAGGGFEAAAADAGAAVSPGADCPETSCPGGGNPGAARPETGNSGADGSKDPGTDIEDAAGTRSGGGVLSISIQKNIPMAAGLAGGSSNCAAVLHGINQLWGLGLSVKELCEIGAKLGSDVPFCIMGQAAAEESLQETFKDDPDACHCALATGTGTDLAPLAGLKSCVVLSKPAIGVSTAEVYQGIDNEGIPVHPDNEAVIAAIRENNYKVLEEKMVNVLENFTLKRYPIIVYTKNMMSDLCQSAEIPGCVMMSGSGPTVFCLCEKASDAQRICEAMRPHNPESFVVETTA